jgi:branched-chain amino acid transport system ATP-binding protein
MEGGRIQYSGTAQELRDKPDLLHSAYLLRGGADDPPVPLSAPSESLPTSG